MERIIPDHVASQVELLMASQRRLIADFA